MKHTKFLIVGATSLVALGNLALGASYSNNFDSLPINSSILEAGDGWTANDVPGASFDLILSGYFPSGNALNLGDGPSASPPPSVPTVSYSHAYGEFLGGTEVIFEFRLDVGTDAAANDAFSFVLGTGANSFGVHFTPSTGSTWSIGYSTDGGATIITYPALPMLATAVYEMSLSFTQNGDNPTSSDVFVNLESEGYPPLIGSTNVLLDPNSTMSAFSIDWDRGADTTFGSNTISFNNIAVVPEPSSALLFGLAGLGFLSRRRRA